MKEITLDGEELVKIGKLNLETLSTLEYASRAKNIMNKPEEYTEEIERLKRDLAATRDKNGVYLSAENYESMMGQITSHEEHTSELEETSKDLQQTKEKLSQEEFVCSELSVVQESLYNTAGQLLSTVDASTSDVMGLHDKLDRKKKVEQHNSEMQQSFSQRMEGALSSMQRCIQQHGDQHHRMLGSYSQAIGETRAPDQGPRPGSRWRSSALVTVASFVGDVGTLVSDGVSRCRDREEHRQDMEDVLVARTLMGLSAVKELNDTLRATVETQRALANKVEAMKEVGLVFGGVVRELAGLREEAGMKQTMQFLQDQLNLLTMEAQQDYTDLHSSSRALQKPLQTLQENISSGCSSVEHQASAQADLLSSTSSSLASSLRLTADESLVQRDLQWTSKARDHAETQAQEHLSLSGKISTEAQALCQSVETRCADQLRTAEEDLTSRGAEATRSLVAVQDQTSADRAVLDQQRAELRDHVETSQELKKKKKKSGKKEAKTLARFKASDNDAATPQRSKLPLR
ncbi:hypothetical protein FQN60_002512, partial [Etheostoma spectabile]